MLSLPPPFLPPPLLSPDIRLHPPTLGKKDSTFLEKNPLSAVIVGKHTLRVMVFIASSFLKRKVGESVLRSAISSASLARSCSLGRGRRSMVARSVGFGYRPPPPPPIGKKHWPAHYVHTHSSAGKAPISPVSSLPKKAFICMHGKGFWYSRQKCRALQERQCSFLFSPSGLKKVSRPSPCFPPSSPSRCM